jgi:hypothetical protein
VPAFDVSPDPSDPHATSSASRTPNAKSAAEREILATTRPSSESNTPRKSGHPAPNAGRCRTRQRNMNDPCRESRGPVGVDRARALPRRRCTSARASDLAPPGVAGGHSCGTAPDSHRTSPARARLCGCAASVSAGPGRVKAATVIALQAPRGDRPTLRYATAEASGCHG